MRRVVVAVVFGLAGGWLAALTISALGPSDCSRESAIRFCDPTSRTLIAAIVAACITGLVAAWAGWWLMSRRDRWAAISLASACGPVLVILAVAASRVPSPFTHLTQFLGVFGGSVLLPAWGLAAVAAGWRTGEGDRSWIRRIGFALGWVELIVFGGLSLLLLALQDALHETL